MRPTDQLSQCLIRTAATRGGAPLRLKLLAAVGLLCLAAAAPARGQNVQFTQGGVGSGLEKTLSIPIASHPGRGEAGMPVALNYSSKVWRLGFIKTVDGTVPGLYGFGKRAVAEAIYAEHSAAGWTTSLDPPRLEWPKPNDRYKYDGSPYKGVGVESYQIQHVYVHMPDGSKHELRKRDNVDGFDGNAREVGDFYAVDGSRLRYHGRPDTTGVLFLPDGSRYEFQFGLGNVQFIDCNGNRSEYDGASRVWTDTLGRPIAQPWPANPQPGVDYSYTPHGFPAPYVFRWNHLSNVLTPGANGQPPALKVVGSYYLPHPDQEPTHQTGSNYPTAQPAGTGALFTPLPEPTLEDETITFVVGRGQPGGVTFNPVVLAEVVMPNGLSYKFTYNEYGEIDKVVYPTGGYEKYTYGQVGSFGRASHPYTLATRGVRLRQQSAAGDDVITSTWAYQGGGPYVKTTLPDLTVTESYRHNFIPGERNFGYDDARNGMEYDVRVWDKDPSQGGVMLRRTLTEWTQTAKSHSLRAATLPNPTVNYTAYRNARSVRSVSLIFDTGGQALAKLVTHQHDTYNTYKELTSGFDRTGVTESHFAEVDPAAAQAAVADKEHPTSAYPDWLFPPASSTVTTYQDGSAYRARNILGLATSVTLRDAAGNPVSKTETEYDQLPLVYYNDIPNDPFHDPGAARGNPTTVRRFVDMALGSYLETRAQFDQYGNPVYNWDERATTFDAHTAITAKEYSAAFRHAYLTRTTTAAPDPGGAHASNEVFTSASDYDYATGLLLTETDDNDLVTTHSYEAGPGQPDPLNRERKVTHPDGSWTKTDYNDVAGNFYVHTETQIDATRSMHAYQFFDGLGRSSRAFTRELGANYIVTETRYDNMGRTRQTSNPFRTTVKGTGGDPRQAAFWETNGQPAHWTTTDYDALGRPEKVTLPDGTHVTTEYVGAYTTVTDQAGGRRRQKTDALGRVIRVDEPGAGGNLDAGDRDSPLQPSFYEFDARGNVVRISQGLSQPGANPEDHNSYVQHRYFKYDALSRLTHEKQAEQAGTINAADPLTGNPSWSRRLTYDETRDGVNYRGLLTTAEDARHVLTYFRYDRHGRPYRVDYSDGTPTVTNKYDQPRTDAPPAGAPAVAFRNKGHLTEVTTAASTTAEGWAIPQTQQFYDFDLMGRTRRHRQSVGAHTYELRYDHNLGGGLVSERYPSGRVVTYGYDDAGRPLGTAGGATAYASAMSYTPSGGLESMTLGNSAVYSMTYDGARLQLSSISLTKDANVLQRYEYKYGAVDMATGAVDGSKNGGQLASVESTVGAQRLWQQRFEYDLLGRLASAGEHYGEALQHRTYLLNYDYDVYGNRYQKAARNQGNQVAQSWVEDGAYSAATNRFASGLTYDEAGNVVADGRFRQRKFWYNANNRQRQSSNLDDSGAVQNVYDGAGQRVATMASGALTRVMVYDVAGDLVAEYGGPVFTNGTQYVMGDQQGSTRLTMRGAPVNNQLVLARQDYLPFGEDIPDTAGPRAGVAGYSQRPGPRQAYADMERDDSTGMGHTLWREYDPLSARWTAPDPYGGSIELATPQSFNRYTYVVNNPVNLTDPSGLMAYDGGYGADVGWGSVAGGFWGGGFDFSTRAITNHIAEAMARDASIHQTGYDPELGIYRGDVEVEYIPNGAGYSITTTLHNPTPEQLNRTMDSMADSVDLVAQRGGGGGGRGPRSSPGRNPRHWQWVATGRGRGRWQYTGPGSWAAGTGRAVRTPLRQKGSHLSPNPPAANGFNTFDALKKALGGNVPGAQWHHVVEQNPANIARFGPTMIHNVNNIILVDTPTHQRISGYYSSHQPFIGRHRRVRDWLSTQSYQAQHNFGMQVLRNHGVIP
jgi:RHS repeat-associated protein